MHTALAEVLLRAHLQQCQVIFSGGSEVERDCRGGGRVSNQSHCVVDVSNKASGLPWKTLGNFATLPCSKSC